MKKNKFLSLIMAAAMLLVLAAPFAAFAASGQATITITPPEGVVLDAGDFEAYRLFDLEIHNEEYVYTPVAEIDAFLDQSGKKAKYGRDAEEFRQNLQDAVREHDDDFLIELAKDLTLYGGFIAETNKEEVDGDIVFSKLVYGYYLITGSGERADNGGAIISRSMLVNVPDAAGNEDIQINLKADAPWIKKEVKNDAGSWAKETDRNIGDAVQFRITSTVPSTKGYDKYTFTVTDTMSKGLTYVGPITITITDPAEVGEAIADTDINYAASTSRDSTSGVTTITITFDANDFITLPIGWDIEILYSAKLNADAVVGPAGNLNSAVLTYSNNPNWDGAGEQEPTGDTPPSIVKVYTFDVNIKKIDGVDKVTVLPGAQFILKTTANGAGLWFNTVNGAYVLAETQASGNGRTQTLTSNASGLIKIEGLDAGTYYLEETKAPSGYNKLDSDVVITIAYKGQGKYEVNGFENAAVKVENKTGGILPGTGGIGTYIFYIAGAILAVLMVAAFIYRKRMSILD